MPVRNRGGKLEWRFKVQGHEYSQVTDLADTERNRIKAARMEAKARELVLDGRASELRLQVQPFSSAADAFNVWAAGEYRDHPGTAARYKVSTTSLKQFYGKRPLSSITAGDVEDYKAWRRGVHKVREVTLKHDLDALSLIFWYGKKHNWCKGNPAREVEAPSDKDAVRINVLSPAAEMAYFAACETLEAERLKHKRPYEARGFRDLHDLGRLMILQGCRPEELREMEQADVDLEAGTMRITHGKSDGAKRTLRLVAESRSILATRLQTSGRWVFPSGKNPGQHIGQHQRLHAAALKRAKVACVPYDFRHTFATRAIERGMDLPTLAAILGHGRGNLRSVAKYVHMTQAHMDAGMRKYEAGIQKPKPIQDGNEKERRQ